MCCKVIGSDTWVIWLSGRRSSDQGLIRRQPASQLRFSAIIVINDRAYPRITDGSIDRMPEAFGEGGPPVAYATALGFLAAFLISAA